MEDRGYTVGMSSSGKFRWYRERRTKGVEVVIPEKGFCEKRNAVNRRRVSFKRSLIAPINLEGRTGTNTICHAPGRTILGAGAEAIMHTVSRCERFTE